MKRKNLFNPILIVSLVLVSVVSSISPSAALAQAPVNIALNTSRTGYPSPLESDPGWGGGSYPWDILDGLTAYTDTWAHGLAFTGGTGSWMGQPCGWRQATVNFAELKTFNQVRVWHHGDDHIPNTYVVEYWDGATWLSVGGTSTVRFDLRSDTNGWGAVPTETIFPAVTGSKVRFRLNNCDITHGWIYEFEVFADGTPVPATLLFDGFEGATLDPAWMVQQEYGTISLATEQHHSGSQSVKFSPTSGGQREILLTRSLPSPTTGTASVWFYDTAPGQNTLYVLFLVYNSDGSFSTHTGILDWEANYYHAAGPGITDSATTTQRTLGWHHFEAVVGEAGGGLYIDGAQVKSFTGSFTFDRIKLWMFGPGWRPNATYYFDDLEVIGDAPTITFLTASATGGAEIYPGDSVSVDLTLQDANELYAAQATCTVDAAILQPQSAAFGNFFDPVNRLIGANNADATADMWTGAISQRSPAEPLSGDGLFATITYAAQSPGTTSITCDPLLSDQDGFTQPVTFTGTDITVLPFATVNGTVTYQGRLDHSGITLTATGSETFTTVTDSEGNFTLELKAGDYTIVASAEGYLSKSITVTVTSGESVTLPSTVLQGGSVNGDNVIDIGDATLVAANFGLTVPPGDARADINDDGVVNVQDLAILGSNYGLSGNQSW